MMEKFFKHIIAAVSLLALSGTLFASYRDRDNTDSLRRRDAMDELWTSIASYTREEVLQAQIDVYNIFPQELHPQAFALEARHVQRNAISRNIQSRGDQAVQQQPALVQQNGRIVHNMHLVDEAIHNLVNVNQLSDQAIQQQQCAAPSQSRYAKEDKAVMSTVVSAFAYWGMYHYLLSAKVAAHMPHPDYAFAVGSAGIAAWLAHKAYTAKCENTGDKIIKSVVCVGAASAAIYACDFMLRSKN